MENTIFKEKKKSLEINTNKNMEINEFKNDVLIDSQEEQLEKNKINMDMPVNLSKSKVSEDDDVLPDTEDDYDDKYVEQKESVAMNGKYQVIDKDVDGHYMKSLKKELNEEHFMRDDFALTLTDYTTEMIQNVESEGILKKIKSKMYILMML